jgi:hypothetical protein
MEIREGFVGMEALRANPHNVAVEEELLPVGD